MPKLCHRILATILVVGILGNAGRSVAEDTGGTATVKTSKAKAPQRPSRADQWTGLFFNPNYPKAHGLDFSTYSGWQRAGRISANIGIIFLGIMSSMALHELAHYITAEAVGVHFKWPASGFDGPFLPLWEIDEDATNGEKIAVGSAGFIIHVISTEIILWVPQIPKDNLFVLSFLLTSILNNLFYPITDAVMKGGYGDIKMLREAGANIAQVHIPMVLHSLLSLARLFFLADDFKGRFNPWATQEAAGVDLVLLRW